MSLVETSRKEDAPMAIDADIAMEVRKEIDLAAEAAVHVEEDQEVDPETEDAKRSFSLGRS